MGATGEHHLNGGAGVGPGRRDSTPRPDEIAGPLIMAAAAMIAPMPISKPGVARRPGRPQPMDVLGSWKPSYGAQRGTAAPHSIARGTWMSGRLLAARRDAVDASTRLLQ